MIGYELLLPVVTSFLIVTPVVLALVSFCVLVGLAGIPWVRGRPSWLLFLGVLLTLGIALFTSIAQERPVFSDTGLNWAY